MKYAQWAKSPKKLSEGVRLLIIKRSKYSAMLSKIHSYVLYSPKRGLQGKKCKIYSSISL